MTPRVQRCCSVQAAVRAELVAKASKSPKMVDLLKYEQSSVAMAPRSKGI